MTKRSHITPALFGFLRELTANNERDWFKANKGRYEETVRDPLLAFIGEFAAPLRSISPHFTADPRPLGGSLFRIHRDTRFSKDKTPYKTHAGVHFRHEAAKNAFAPGFYLHLEPGGSFIGAGIWHPDAATLLALRSAIAGDPAKWRRAISGKRFREQLALDAGEPLKRVPRGFDPEHPAAEDLKRRSVIAIRDLREQETCAPDFAKELAASFAAAKPLLGFVCEALELPL